MKDLFKILSFLGMFVIIVTTHSCKKSDPAPVDVAATLQNKNWKLTALTVSPAIGGTTDIYNDAYEDCERDNLYKFNAANIFEYDEGPSLCYAGDPQTRTGTWSYNGSNKMLHYTLLADEWDLTITETSDNLFKATSVDIISGVSYTSTWTFIKQ